MVVGLVEFSEMINDTLDQAVQRVKRSMLVVRNGHGAGAGVAWRKGGYVITNKHVIGRGRVQVLLPDGRDVPAHLLASDPEIDLALLQVDAPTLPPALVADSHNLRIGQMVLAVGHPWGQRNLVTAGIISGLSHAQTNGRRGSVPVIRSDVVLAPGNSGGPMVNAVGAVVGINTMIVGGDVGVAIPSQVVNSFVNEFLGEQLEVS